MPSLKRHCDYSCWRRSAFVHNHSVREDLGVADLSQLILEIERGLFRRRMPIPDYLRQLRQVRVVGSCLIELGSRCGPCTPKRKTRDTAHAGTDWRWRKLSEKLRRASPFCERCGAKTRLTCDHIIPVSEDPTLAYEPLNVRVLCRACNTARRTTCTEQEREQVLSAIAARKQRLASYYANQR